MTPRSPLPRALAQGVVLPLLLASSFAVPTSAQGVWENHAGVPGPRWNAVSTVDAARGVMFLHGGQTQYPDGPANYTYSILTDLWEIDLATGASRTLRTTGLPFYNYSPHGLIFDGERDQLVLVFGPRNVWFLSLATGVWTHPTYAPGHVGKVNQQLSVVLDEARDRLLMWGGSAFGDSVWSVSLTDAVWEHMPVAGTHPGLVNRAPACFDPVRDRMIIYGGSIGVWALTLSPAPTWSQLPVAPPSPTATPCGYAFMDVEADRMILAGDMNTPWGTGSMEVSALPFSEPLAWQVLRPFPAADVPEFNHPSVVFDPVGRRLVSFGGAIVWTVPDDIYGSLTYYDSQDAASRFPLDDPSLWVPTSAPGLPHPPVEAVVFDPVNQRIVVVENASPTRTYEMPVEGPEPRGFREIGTAGTLPPGITEPQLLADVAHGRLILFGRGPQLSGPFGLWTLPLEGAPEWSQLTATGSPPGWLNGSSAVYDPTGHRTFVFGGDSSGVFTNDTFVLDLDGAPSWTRLAMGSKPASRSGHVAVYDALLERMIVFGGNSAQGLRNDTWELSLAGTPQWSLIQFEGLVEILPRVDATAVLDQAGRRMLVYGGRRPSGALDDLWALPLDTGEGWQRVDVPTPSARFGAASTYDGSRRQWWMAGGQTPLGGPRIREVWTFTEPTLLGVGGRPGTGRASLAFAPPSPNPSFGPVTLTFTLVEAADVRLDVFDISGRIVDSQSSRPFGAGRNTIRWDGRDGARGRLAPGLYVLRLDAAGLQATRRVLLIR